MLRTPIALILFSFLSLSVPAGEALKGKCIRIIDGSTIELENKQSKGIVTLAGLKAPELKDKFGNKARMFLSRLILNKDIVVVYNNEWSNDRKRIVGVVLLQGQINVNATIINNGFALNYIHSCDLLDYQEYERKAREERRGIWSLPEYSKLDRSKFVLELKTKIKNKSQSLVRSNIKIDDHDIKTAYGMKSDARSSSISASQPLSVRRDNLGDELAKDDDESDRLYRDIEAEAEEYNNETDRLYQEQLRINREFIESGKNIFTDYLPRAK